MKIKDLLNFKFETVLEPKKANLLWLIVFLFFGFICFNFAYWLFVTKTVFADDRGLVRKLMIPVFFIIISTFIIGFFVSSIVWVFSGICGSF